MKKNSLFMIALAGLMTMSTLSAEDLARTIPNLNEEATEISGYQKVADVAQYGLADWKNVVGIARGVSLERAREIADKDPAIDFFFYLKGGQMVLGNPPESYRLFRHGDAVFFTGQPWWGSAPDLADGYIKIKK